MNLYDPHFENRLMMTRRQLFGRSALGVGTAAMANLLGNDLLASSGPAGPGTHHPAKAKRVIYLFMSGGPSHHDTYDPKPDAPREYAGIWNPIRTLGEIQQVTDSCCRLPGGWSTQS